VPPADGKGRLELVLRATTAALAVLGLALGIHYFAFSSHGRVIFQDSRAPWIMLDTPVDMKLRQYGQQVVPTATFSTSFDLPRAPEAATLLIRTLGRGEVALNGSPLEAGRDPALGWRKFQHLDATPHLVSGRNELRVRVRNARGPALLSLVLEADDFEIATSSRWSGAAGDDPPGPTLLATDQRPLPSARYGEAPVRMLLRHWPALLLLGLAASGCFLALRGRLTEDTRRRLPQYCFQAICFGWIALFAFKLGGLPIGYGFDAMAHLEYVDLLREGGQIPRAQDGWATYHPPLFYLLTLALSFALGLVGVAYVLAVKLVPFAAGLGIAWLGLALTRRLLPEDRVAWIWATLFGGLLPANLVLAAYVSNEGLHAFLTGAGLLTAVDLLLATRITLRRVTLCSALFGLAMLTKFTAIIVAVPALLAVAIKLAAEPSRVEGRPVSAFGALLIPMLALSGPFFFRNLVEHGTLFVWNVNMDLPGQVWWSPPGFHTPAYYTHFGEVFLRPFLGGFVSFWDTVYSTFWGDGLLAGQTTIGTRHGRWNYEFMAASYVLALPATGLTLAGFARAAWQALDRSPARPDSQTHSNGQRRAALALLVLVCAALACALFLSTLRVPYHGQARVLYIMACAPALAYFFASELRCLDRWLAARGLLALRAGLVAYLGALFGFLYLSFVG